MSKEFTLIHEAWHLDFDIKARSREKYQQQSHLMNKHIKCK